MEQTTEKRDPRIARIRAKKDGNTIIACLSDRRKITVEKSALMPAGTTSVRWQDGAVTRCGVAVIPAKPNDIRFIASDVFMLIDPNYAEAEIKRMFQIAERWAPTLKYFRIFRCRLSIGEMSELSGVDGLTIARMEAGYPAYPFTAKFKVLHSCIRLLWRRSAARAAKEEDVKKVLAENPLWQNLSSKEMEDRLEHMLESNQALTDGAKEYIRIIIADLKEAKNG
jgi:hypothetical protein